MNYDILRYSTLLKGYTLNGELVKSGTELLVPVREYDGIIVDYHCELIETENGWALTGIGEYGSLEGMRARLCPSTPVYHFMTRK